jgi:hypothetical protein
MSDEIKVKVSADGATQAAAGVDKLVSALEKQRKSQEMIAATTASIRRQNVVDALKQEAAAVNGVTASLQKNQQVTFQAAQSLNSFSVNSQQLRQRLSPAAALVGNLSNSLSVLVPEAGGAAKALQIFGMAGSQMLGVLGGGPGIIIGGLVAGIGALGAIMASSKKDADELAKSTEANAKAMGSYLDQLQKLRSEVGAARSQQKSEGDLQNRLRSGQGSSEEYGTEIDVLQKRLSNQYYSDSTLKGLLGAGNRDEWDKRQQARRRLEGQRDKYTGFQSSADEQERLLAQQAADKRTLGLELEASGTPSDPKSGGKGMQFQDVRGQLDKLREMQNESQDKIAEYARQQRQNSYDLRMLQLKDEVEASNKAIDEKAAYEEDARRRKAEAEQKAHDQRIKAEQDLKNVAVQSAQIIAGAGIKTFQTLAKGQKAQIGQILEGIGDQAVAMGTMTIFDGIAKSIALDARGPGLIGIGTAEVAFGIGLGAAGARAPGGSSAGGGKASDNPFGANPYSNPSSPVNEDRGPTIININMPTVVSPSPEDGVRIQRALDASARVYGR